MKCPICGGEARDEVGLCEACGTALDHTLADSAAIAPRPPSPDPTPAPAPAPPRRADIAARCLLCSVLSEPVRLEEGAVYRIGRDRTNDVCFPSTHVSRLHAEVTFEKGQWVVGDLGSKNGTTVNGERVFKRALRDGDRVGVGNFQLVYRELSSAELEELRARKKDRLSDTLEITQDEIGFFGDLRKLSVVEVVQLLGQNRKTGILTIIEEKGSERSLRFADGAIVHAECRPLSGEPAVVSILRTRTGRFAFRPTEEGREIVTVKTPTQTLLLQAVEAIKR